jgi:hypothetical protein
MCIKCKITCKNMQILYKITCIMYNKKMCNTMMISMICIIKCRISTNMKNIKQNNMHDMSNVIAHYVK